MDLGNSTFVCTVRELIDRMAERQPGHEFLIAAETGATLTFGNLQARARHLSGKLRQAGLIPGDKIAISMSNSLATAELFLGVMYGGFVVVPLNVRAGLSQLSFTLEHCDAKLVIADGEYDGLTREAMAPLAQPVPIVSPDFDSWPQNLDAGRDGPIAESDVAMIMYSSGTTGQPHGAVHTHRSVLAHGRNSVEAHRLTSADRSLLVLPLYHINAECVTLIPTLLSGGSVVVPHGFMVSEFWNWLDDYRCTWSALVPTIISQLLDWKDPKARKPAMLRSVSASCAAPRRHFRPPCTRNFSTSSSCR